MSFGASPSDIITVVAFCKTLYRKCRDASGEYDEISREVKNLHRVLRLLQDQVQNPESPLNHDRSIWSRQLAPIVSNCDSTLRQLDSLLQKHGRLVAISDLSPSSPRAMWERLRLGSNEMDQLGAIRVKLISHKTSLSLFLDTIKLRESGNVGTELDSEEGQLDVILDKVDAIAARMNRNAGSLTMKYGDDDTEVWKEFRRELVVEGFERSVLQKHKDVLRAYIREIDQKGLLDDSPEPIQAFPHGKPENPDQRQNAMGLASSGGIESSTPSRKVQGAKKAIRREDNLKFPVSMKQEWKHTDLRRNVDSAAPSENPLAGTQGDRRQLSSIPRITRDGQKLQYLNRSSDESDTSTSPEDTSNGVVIQTSDLVLLPSSFDRPTSPDTDRTRHYIEYQQNETSDRRPSSSSAIPGSIPIRSSNTSTNGLGINTQQEPSRLAPDSQGKEIPPDASWTKISRHLVSLEVLNRDRRRYEARPDFVAVLGVLSRQEIEAYAIQSQDIRAARTQRNRPPRSGRPGRRGARKRRASSPTSTDSSSDSSSDSDHKKCWHRRKGHHKTSSVDDSDTHRGRGDRGGKGRRGSHGGRSSSTDTSSSSDPEHRRGLHQNKGYRGSGHHKTPSIADSDTTPHSGYPNPYGQPVPLQTSPYTASNKKPQTSPTSPEQDYASHSSSSRRHNGASTGYSRRSSHGDRDRERDRVREKEVSKRRWKEHLTAAGIGGAAISLLSVLTEAAEGL